jgi:uncharacterized protein DUF6504
MSKLINEPIRVHHSESSGLMAFIWRKRLYRVSDIINCWREPSDWWQEKPLRQFFRVNASHRSTGVYEVCQQGEEWFLHRVFD